MKIELLISITFKVEVFITIIHATNTGLQPSKITVKDINWPTIYRCKAVLIQIYNNDTSL